jgi:hypothetical protein
MRFVRAAKVTLRVRENTEDVRSAFKALNMTDVIKGYKYKWRIRVLQIPRDRLPNALHTYRST